MAAVRFVHAACGPEKSAPHGCYGDVVGFLLQQRQFCRSPHLQVQHKWFRKNKPVEHTARRGPYSPGYVGPLCSCWGGFPPSKELAIRKAPRQPPQGAESVKSKRRSHKRPQGLFAVKREHRLLKLYLVFCCCEKNSFNPTSSGGRGRPEPRRVGEVVVSLQRCPINPSSPSLASPAQLRGMGSQANPSAGVKAASTTFWEV